MKKLLFTLVFASFLFACSKDAAFDGSSGKSGSITRFAVFQNYMYVLNLNEVQTYDLTDKQHPKLVHRLSTDYGLETIIVYNNTVFIGSTTSLYILDTSNPAAPGIKSKTDRVAFSTGGCGCDPVVVKDNYAYSTIKVIENGCGCISAVSALVVYDVTDQSAPAVVGTYFLSIPDGLGYKDSYLFVCDEGVDELIVFDISNPTSLVQTSYSVSIIDPVDLIVDGERMIVSTKTGFEIFDIRDVTQIRKVGQITK
jgi:hypothetical protein